jgi:acetyltransferase-like isoleucine patch superfamily enzyme
MRTRATSRFRGLADPARSARRQVGSFQPRLSLALALNGLLPPYTGDSLRLLILRAGGVRIGERTGIGGRLWVAGGTSPAGRIEIGADCFLNDGCRFDVSAPVTIGDRVFLGHDVAVLTASHLLGDSWRRAGHTIAEPVTIGHGSWVGARATILSGVTIGEAAVVAAGAVVIRSVPPNTLVGGVPATVIRDLEE